MCLGKKGMKEVEEERIWGVVVECRGRLWVGGCERREHGIPRVGSRGVTVGQLSWRHWGCGL